MGACVHERIEIDAPVQEVWELVMDPRRHGEWVTMHRESRGLPEGEMGEGESFEQTLCLAGRTFDVEWTLVERDEPRLAVWSAAGPRGAAADVRYELQERDGRTVFDYTNDFELPGGVLGKVAKRAAGGPARRQARKSLQLLKRSVEGGS